MQIKFCMTEYFILNKFLCYNQTYYFLFGETMTDKTVLVGLSGGVDSSVCAALLKEQGYNVIGATMAIWGNREVKGAILSENRKNACFGPHEKEDIESAEKIAKQLNIPFHVFDCAQQYNEIVLKYFKSEYIQGKTPNPCIWCNALIKFGVLPYIAKMNGVDFDYFATGHYARIEKENGAYVLKRGKYSKKDQSYFLYRLTQEQLAKIKFPLGEYNKEEIRQIAKNYGLNSAKKPDSQDFYEGDYNELLNVEEKIGNIVDTDGKILGTHKGIWNYTTGQRKGIGIAANEAMYVLELKKDTNEVVIGPKDKTFKNILYADRLNVLSYGRFNSLNKIQNKVTAKIRSTQEPVDVSYEIIDNDSMKVTFADYQKSIATGQSVVLYDNDVVIAGGVIDRAE